MLVLAIAIATLYLAREVLIPLAFAVILTLVLTPAVAWLQKIRLGRVPAVLLVMAVLMAVAGGVGWVIANQLVAVANQLPTYQKNIHNKIEAMSTPGVVPLGRATQSMKELGQELLSPATAPSPPSTGERRTSAGRPVSVNVVETPQSELEHLRDVITPFLRPAAKCGFVLIFCVFLLIKREDLRNRLLRLAGLGQLNLMTQALDDATQRVSRYLLLQFLVNAGFGVLFGAGLYFIGVPYAALWGAVAGLLRIVPYVGTLVAAILPMALSLAAFDSWVPPVLVLVLFVALELVIANFLEPWLYGAHTGISSLAILATTVLWTVLWGTAGLILATPLTVCVVVLGRYVPQLSFLHVLLGDEPVLAAEAQVYQRLLAMDPHEARAVADVYLKDRSLMDLYDSVLIPALTMAEQDRHKGALDPAREEFLFLSVKEMIAEFTGYAEGPSPRLAAGVRVLCVPASDEADEITASMLAQLMEQSGCGALSFPAGTSIQESLGALETSSDDVVCISALPPFAFAHARTRSRQLRERFPKVRLVIGVWGFSGDMEQALRRFDQSRPEKLLTSLAGAMEYLVGSAGDEEAGEVAAVESL